MKRTLLATAICAGPFATGTVCAQTTTSESTQDQITTQSSNTAVTAPKKDNKTETLQAITVTGSRIPKAQIETANPVITITGRDIEKKDYADVYRALRARPFSLSCCRNATCRSNDVGSNVCANAGPASTSRAAATLLTWSYASTTVHAMAGSAGTMTCASRAARRCPNPSIAPGDL